MKNAKFAPLETRTDNSLQFIPQKENASIFNVAIVGGGEACHSLLRLFDQDRLTKLRMKVLGVSDVNPEAPGFRYAREVGLFTTSDVRDLLKLRGLSLIIELTGSNRIAEEILKMKPVGVSLIDHRSARLLWELFQIEAEKTELERVRQDLQEKEKRRIQVILDSLPYRIMVVNLDMTVDAVNRTFFKDFGVTPQDVKGKYCYEVRYGLDKPCKDCGSDCYLENHLGQLREKGLFSTFKEYLDEEGNSRFDVITIAPILNEQGEVVQIVEASRDVTTRAKLEREVEKAKIFFQNVIESTVDGIVVVDTKGSVLIFNEGMERLTGYSSQEMVSQGHLSNFYDIDLAKENMRKMRSDQYGPPGKLNPTSMTITSKDGEEIPVTLSASIITIDGKEVGSVGVFTDMREILQMRRDLEDAHLQLVQSEKIASVGRMAAGVAHEINNPLSGILIYAELLKENLKEDPQNLKDVQEIIDQTLRSKRIVSELLEFSRQSIGKASSFSLENLIKQCLNLLIHQAVFQNIEVAVDIAPELPEMVGDVGQLQQVFTNLFINAADAMEGKGKLTVQACFDPSRSVFTIRVSDTGPGIPEDSKDKVFDIFFTTKPIGKGTGLGLSISQNIIKLHGGTITFECPKQGGTTFIIEVPLEVFESHEEQPVFIGLDET